MTRPSVILGVLIGLVLTLSVGPAVADEGLEVVWPAATSVGTETPYSFDVHDTGPGTLSVETDDGTWWPVLKAGRTSLDFDNPGPRLVVIRRCVEEDCWVAASRQLEVFEEARLTGVVYGSRMGPHHAAMSAFFAKPAGWVSATVTWELSRELGRPAVASGSAAFTDSGRFVLRVPRSVPTGRYVASLHFLVRGPDGVELPTDSTVTIDWVTRTTGRFGPTPLTIHPGRTNARPFVGAVRTSSPVLRASAMVLDRRGRVVRRLPAVHRLYGDRIRVTWRGLSSDPSPGRFLVRVTWTDLARNRGRASRVVLVRP